jgi:subtilase family serine protease
MDHADRRAQRASGVPGEEHHRLRGDPRREAGLGLVQCFLRGKKLGLELRGINGGADQGAAGTSTFGELNTMIHPYIQLPRPRSVLQTWSILNLCAAYKLPTNLTGSRPVGIIEFAGAYAMSDVQQFCAANHLPVPSITNIGVPYPPDPGGADVEVALDMQVVIAATSYMRGAPLPIRMYWAPNTADGFEWAFRQAADDGCSVLSISWGEDEALTGEEQAKANQAAAWYAVQHGCICVAATGDNSSSDGGQTPKNVDQPSSCPSVWAVGGTTKPMGGVESVWGTSNPDGSGTGCGYSAFFPFDAKRQKGAPAPPKGLGRMVPDCAAVADPETGYQIYVGGGWISIGGTSGAAPFWASILACLDLPRMGLYTKLWDNPQCFVDITKGESGFYAAAMGPDPASGMGVPNGANFGLLAVANGNWKP